jgi:Ni,Fe-hydrogenase III large subunit
MLGYVHRGLEKIGEQKDYTQNVFLVERVCGICSFIGIGSRRRTALSPP